MLILNALLFGLATCLVAHLAKLLWSKRRLFYLAAKLPGPRGLPFIGMGHKMLTSDFKKMFKAIMTVTDGYESPARFWLGPELLVFAETPEALKIVLNSPHCLNKTSLYEAFSLDKGLIVAGGEMWKSHRKILNPAFSLNVLQQLVPTFNEKSKILVENLAVEVGREPFDIFFYLSACSLETLLEGTMNLDRDIQKDALHNEYVHNIEITTSILMTRILNVFYQIKPIYRLTKLYQLEQKHYHQGVLKIADEVLEDQKNISKNISEQSSEVYNDGHASRPRNYINTLLDSKHRLTGEEIRDEINSIIAAGHDTSALVLSNCLLMLASHSEVQRKVVAELKEVYGSADTPVDYASINKLDYLDKVLKETMRLFPVLPVSGRESSGEFQIGDYTIPAGATIVIAAYKVQRNPKYWGEDAHLFRPERFNTEEYEKVPPYAYIPFTGGPRICIGWRYGMLFMKTVLANFLRKYEVNTPLRYEELEFELVITMKVAQKCMITLNKRDFS